MKKINWSKLPSLTAFSFVIIFLYIPIVILIIFSFNDTNFPSTWRGFTLRHYVNILSDREILPALRNTFILGLLTTLISTVIGIFAALSLENLKFKGRKFFSGLIYLPLVMPDILLGVSLLIFFSSFNARMGMLTVLIAHITFCISYTIIVIQSRLQGFDKSLEEAAMDLGANKTQIFFQIKLPLMVPGILAAALLAFTLSLDDYVITFFTTGGGYNTLPLIVEGTILGGRGASPISTINAISTVIICFTIILAFLTSKVKKYIW